MSTIIVVDTDWIADGAVTEAKLAPAEKLTTGNVGLRSAGLAASSIGSYMFARVHSISGDQDPGWTRPGSNLSPASSDPTWHSSTLPGTWRLMGFVSSPLVSRASLWLRIS